MANFLLESVPLFVGNSTNNVCARAAIAAGQFAGLHAAAKAG